MKKHKHFGACSEFIVGLAKQQTRKVQGFVPKGVWVRIPYPTPIADVAEKLGAVLV